MHDPNWNRSMTQRLLALNGSSACLRAQRTSGSLECEDRKERARSTNGDAGRPSDGDGERGGDDAYDGGGELGVGVGDGLRALDWLADATDVGLEWAAASLSSRAVK